MANISQLNLSFVDGTTLLNAQRMNAIVSKINELVTAVNSGSSGGDTPVTITPPTIAINGPSVTITAESGATLRYTTNGSTPTASSGTAVNSNTVTFSPSGDCTIKAVAIKSGTTSSVASQSYTAQSVTPVAPTMVLNTSAKTVALSAPSGLTIKYSTDGSTPATTYASAINVANGATIKAITTNGSQSSSVPKITVTYNESSGTIEFATSETGTIRYTTNGSNPTASSTAYASAINPVSGTTYKIAVYNGSTINSEIATVQISA